MRQLIKNNDDGVSAVLGTMLSIVIMMLFFAAMFSVIDAKMLVIDEKVLEKEIELNNKIENITNQLDEVMLDFRDRNLGQDGIPPEFTSDDVLQFVANDTVSTFSYTNSTIYIEISIPHNHETNDDEEEIPPPN